MLSSSILNMVTFKDLTSGTNPNKWNTLHENRKHGGFFVKPFCQVFNKDIAATEQLLLNSELSTEKRIELENELADLKHQNNINEGEEDKKLHEEKLERQKQLVDGLVQLGSKIFEFTIANTNAELSALEEKNKKGIISDKEYAKQKSALELKKAKQEQAQGIFNAVISTAQAVIGFLADPGGLPGVALSVLAGLTGAIEIAKIKSEPLPKYWTGTKNAKEIGVAGDRGRELATLTSGENVMFEKPTLFAG